MHDKYLLPHMNEAAVRELPIIVVVDEQEDLLLFYLMMMDRLGYLGSETGTSAGPLNPKFRNPLILILNP
jgi:hypothetical protein